MKKIFFLVCRYAKRFTLKRSQKRLYMVYCWKMFAFLSICIIFLSACSSYTEPEIIENEINEPTPFEAAPTEEPADIPIEYTYLFYLELYAGKIFLDSEIQTAIEILGEPNHVHETPSCAFDGMDRIFTFSEFYIHTYPMGDKDLIQIIRFRTDNMTTGEGFRLGNSFDTVTEVLGFDYLRDFDMIVFIRENTSLVFSLQDNIIVHMFYELIMGS